MKIKCSDGKTRNFRICRNQTIVSASDGKIITLVKLLEAECAECGEQFGCHDTYILKPYFRAHICQKQKDVVLK